jgi:hypothetical protein
MKVHHGCPTITKCHKLTRVTPVAKLTNAHSHSSCSQTNIAHRHPTYNQIKNNAYSLHTYYIPQIEITRLKPDRSNPTKLK